MKCVNQVIIMGGPHAGVHPCGHCAACLRNKVMEWSARILHESSEFEYNTFLTLTYNAENLPEKDGFATLKKEDLRNWLKRFRKEINGRKIKYFGCGEYGDRSHRPHYHLILLGVGMDDKQKIEKTWGKGFITLSPINYKRIKYTVGYVMKKKFGLNKLKFYAGREPVFQVQSKGIGERYVERNMDHLIRNVGFTVNGVKAGLSRYYKDKIGTNVPSDYWERKATEAKDKIIAELLCQGYSYSEASIELTRQKQQKAENLIAKGKLSERKN